MVNFITVNVLEEHKSFTDNDQRRTGNGYINAETGVGRCVEKKASKKGLGNNNFLEKDIVLKNEQNGSKLKLADLESPQASGQHNDEVVVYEFDVRAEQMTPVQEKQQMFSCICEPDCALHNSQAAMSELPIYGTKQGYSPQFDTQAPDTSFRQQVKKVLVHERNSASLQLYDAEVPLINFMADEPNQAHSCSECDVMADICLVPDPKKAFLDEKEAALKEPHALLSLITQKTTSKLHRTGTRTRENQETGMEEEQSKTVDWNPWTGRMYLSSLPVVTKEDKIDPPKYEESLEEALLFRLYESHCSEDLLGRYENMYLLQLKEHWGLHIEMQT